MSKYKKTTVVFLVQDDRILLGMKKRGFGAGWWNGYGGKLEGNESYEQNAVREVEEESGITLLASHLTRAADLVFRFDSNVDVVTRAYIARDFSGKAVETEEMKPQWFAGTDVPYDTMWPGDDKWIPAILANNAALPKAFIVDFTAKNEFVAIEEVSATITGPYF